MSISLGVLCAAVIWRSLLWSTREGKGLLDWGSFVASGRAASDGLDPYGVYELTFRVGPMLAPAPNLNPPISVYAFELAAKLHPQTSADLWFLASLGCYLAAVVLLSWAYPGQGIVALLAAFSMAGLWHTLELGQIYTPLVLAATGAWIILRSGDDARAGILIGLIVAIKPQFAVWPLFLLLGGHWRSGTAGLGTAAALFALPVALGDAEMYRQWFRATPPLLPAMTFAGNSSLLAVFGRLGLAVAGLLVAGAFAALYAFVIIRERPRATVVSAFGLLAALLLGPITWPGYTLLLLPVLFAFGWDRLAPIAALFIVPYWLVLELSGEGGAMSFLAGSIYGFAVLLLATYLLLRRDTIDEPEGASRSSVQRPPRRVRSESLEPGVATASD